MNLNAHYRNSLWGRHPELPLHSNAKDVPAHARRASLRREKASHRGIGTRTALRELSAGAVNQEFLEEIARLTDLEHLELGWPVTATDLGPLRALVHLRHLEIRSPRNIDDFTPILDLPRLDRLFIENAKHLERLDWLIPLKDRLIALGIEGSMWTHQRIESLAPLGGFKLEALFLTSTRLGDKDLSPIATMPNIRFLGTARNAPRAQFLALRDALPELRCDWFDEANWQDSKSGDGS